MKWFGNFLKFFAVLLLVAHLAVGRYLINATGQGIVQRIGSFLDINSAAVFLWLILVYALIFWLGITLTNYELYKDKELKNEVIRNATGFGRTLIAFIFSAVLMYGFNGIPILFCIIITILLFFLMGFLAVENKTTRLILSLGRLRT